MVMIFLTAADKNGKENKFACGLDSFETCFDFLNEIVAGGDTLLSAFVVDQIDVNKRTELPLAAFDGIPCSVVIKALQDEWQTLVNEPDQTIVLHQEAMILLIQRRIRHYQLHMASSERMIDYFTNLLRRTKAGFSQGPIREGIIQRYESTIERYKQLLVKARLRSLLATDQLSRLAH